MVNFPLSRFNVLAASRRRQRISAKDSLLNRESLLEIAAGPGHDHLRIRPFRKGNSYDRAAVHLRDLREEPEEIDIDQQVIFRMSGLPD